MASSRECAQKKVREILLQVCIVLAFVKCTVLSLSGRSARRNAALDVFKERMNASLKAGGGANTGMLAQLSNMFTALSEIKDDSQKVDAEDDKLPFLDLVVKLQFSLDVEIWIDCFKGIEESTAEFKASIYIHDSLQVQMLQPPVV